MNYKHYATKLEEIINALPEGATAVLAKALMAMFKEEAEGLDDNNGWHPGIEPVTEDGHYVVVMKDGQMFDEFFEDGAWRGLCSPLDSEDPDPREYSPTNVLLWTKLPDIDGVDICSVSFD